MRPTVAATLPQLADAAEGNFSQPIEIQTDGNYPVNKEPGLQTSHAASKFP